MRKIGIGAITRAIGLIAVGAAIVATDVHLRQNSVSPTDRLDARAAPLARELTRCQAIGMAAKDDTACQAAWAENRRRFFAPPFDQPSAPAPRPGSSQPR